MSIGLFDGDLGIYPRFQLNLELMKLATYYKKKREIVVLTSSFDPDRYNKTFYRKDIDDGIFPSELGVEKNLFYGGYAFSKGLYIPLDLEIEKCRPSTSIYIACLENKTFTLEQERNFQRALNAEHLRISLDGQNLWEDFPCQFQMGKKRRNIIFHDYDLNSIKDGDLIIGDIMKSYKEKGRKDALFGTKFPIVASNDKEFLKWIYLPINTNECYLQFNGIMEDSTIFQTTGFRGEIFYNILANFKSENDFANNQMPKIYRQLIYSRMNDIKVQIIYDSSFPIDENWFHFFDFLNYATRLDKEKIKNKDYRIMYVIKRLDEKRPAFTANNFSRREAELLVGFIKDTSFDFFQLLTQCRFVDFKEDEIRAWC